MIAPLRDGFNARFRRADYLRLLGNLEDATGAASGFRIAETPVFLPKSLLDRIAALGAELLDSLLNNPSYMEESARIVPEMFQPEWELPHPHFLAADFALIRAEGGELAPRLIEMQAFPSIAALLCLLADEYRKTYTLDAALGHFLAGHTKASFWALLAKTVLGGHDPENVVLLELGAPRQRTFADLQWTAQRLGICILDPAKLVPEPLPGGQRHLCYRAGRRLVSIARIYNRAVPEEWLRRGGGSSAFDPRRFTGIEWATHPSWYYRVSKFSLPWLAHPAAPHAIFLDQWLEGRGRDRLPSNPAELVLKPLFDFGGSGVRIGPTPGELQAIPPDERRRYLVQQRVHPARPVRTPRGDTQAEVRILYLWPDDGRLEPVLSLIRLGRGQRLGAVQNEGSEWAGVSVGLYPDAD